MSKKIFATLMTLLLVAMQVAPIFAQQQPATTTTTAPPPATPATPTQDQDETITVGTAAVQVEAIVTDKSGRRVSGLTASDFQVMDEGAAQTLDFFTVIEGSRVLKANTSTAAAGDVKPEAGKPDAKPVTPLATPYQGRHIALVFDDLTLSVENVERSRRAFAEYISTKLAPTDMVALMATGGATGTLQQFTNDKQRLLSYLRRIAAQNTRANKIDDDQYNITALEAVRIDAGDEKVLNEVAQREAAQSLANSMSGSNIGTEESAGLRGEVNERDAFKAKIKNAARSKLSRIGTTMQNNIKTLSNLFRGMADLPGRKIVVLLTETFTTLGGSTEQTNNAILQLIEVARRAGVSVYALDAAGLRTTNVGASERITGGGLAARDSSLESFSTFQNLDAARALVSGTGGELIANTNSLTAGLDKAIEDSNSYYVIGFQPRTLDNKFHRLAVTIKNKPDLVVRTRRGYFAINQETVSGTKTELYAALGSPVPRRELPLEVVANVVPRGEEQVVITGLHIGRNYLTLPAATAAEQTAAYEIMTYVFAAGRDQPVGGVERTVTYDLKLPEERQKLKTEGAVLLVKEYTQLPPGAYQLRAVVREKATGMLGTSYEFFEIPNLKERKTVSASSLILTPAGQAAFNGRNSFKPGSEVDVRYLLYNLPKEMAGLVQRLKFTDAQGKALFDSELAIAPPAVPADRTQAPQATRFNLPLARGSYALIYTLKDPKGKIDVERRADLVVE